MEKYITFSVPIKKTITYKLKFIDSFGLMPTSLSNLVDSLSEINKEKCKACINGEINKSECDFIEHENSNLRFKCKKCDRIWLKPSLSNITNSISEINTKECKACMERKISNQSVILWGLKIIN